MFQVDLLVGLFGVSAWLSINAMFTQLPILVQSAPEGWNLPSCLSFLIQLANIGPILYSGSQSYSPRLVTDTKLIYFSFLLGLSSIILLAKYYDHTVVLWSKPHSVVLFVLTFCLALVGCTSSVLFIPFMNNYPEAYLVSYMVGEGLSGFVPSIIALVQGVGGNPSCDNSTTTTGEVILLPHTPPPRFSPTVFFAIIGFIMVTSAVAFYLLNNLTICKKQQVRKALSRNRSQTDSPTIPVYRDQQPITENPQTQPLMSSQMYKALLGLQMIVSVFANGALPSVQSYSCLPYGNLAYHLAVNLGNMANPAACVLTSFMPEMSPRWIISLFLVSNVATCYVFTTAIFSPHPPLQGLMSGTLLIVSTPKINIYKPKSIFMNFADYVKTFC